MIKNKILMITAHPSTMGHTHQISQAYKEEKEKLGAEIHLYDLYKTKHQLPFLSFEDTRAWPNTQAIKHFQDEIIWAEEIVFIHPVWWSGMPAILKNWLDSILQTKFAYRYENGKKVTMLDGRTVKIFSTSGGPAWIYHIFFAPFRLTWTKYILDFCGMETSDFKVCGHMAFPNREENFAIFLEDIRESARKV